MTCHSLHVTSTAKDEEEVRPCEARSPGGELKTLLLMCPWRLEREDGAEQFAHSFQSGSSGLPS